VTADSKGYYAILGVSTNASYQEIKRAYRRMARKYHPDRNNTAFAEDMIKKINAAFEVLSDIDKRKQYDNMSYEDVKSYDSTGMNNNVASTTADSSHTTGDADTRKQRSHAPRHSRSAEFRRRHSESGDTATTAESSTFTQLDTPKGRLHIIVEPSLCMAFGSCEILAPRVFVVEKNKRINPKAIVESETGADFKTILAAAQTCPTKAIKLIDRYTGEQIFP